MKFYSQNGSFSMLGVSWIVLFICALLFSAGIVGYYFFRADLLHKEAVSGLKHRAEIVSNGLQTHLCAVDQMARSTASLIAPIRHDRAAVETLLQRMMQSAPEQTIYGAGAWFEPYRFDLTTRYFGPYVHRDAQNPATPLVLTYEWTTPDYDFPQQNWYLAGKHQPEITVFTEPYFDTDQVYMSAVKAFRDEHGAFNGVVTVDMALPLLHRYILQENDSPSQWIYVSTAKGALFAHPLEDRLLARARQQGKQPTSLLDLNAAAFIDLLDQQYANYYRLRVPVGYTGWHVHIDADPRVLFAQVTNVRHVSVSWIVGIWIVTGIILSILSKMSTQAHRAAQEKNRLEAEILERSLAEQLLQRLNADLDNKVRERTADLESANQQISSLNEQLKTENLRMSAELDITRRLQQMVLPTPIELTQIPSLDIAAYMMPADEVGGDYYDVLVHDNGIKIGIGDVTGHGLESGVVMLMVQMAVRTLLNHGVHDPQIFLSVLNSALFSNVQRMNTDKNLTLALIDYQFSGTLTCVGQHEELIIARHDGQIERMDTSELGFMVGLLPDISKFLSHRQVHLEVGDGIVLYTDGVTEAHSIDSELYGIDRLCESIQKHWQWDAEQIKNNVIADLQAFSIGYKPIDDVTLLVIKRLSNHPFP
jgi:serine phosphatase RsbU (regulator of sigma subunit)